jgi:hypothetical protein
MHRRFDVSDAIASGSTHADTHAHRSDDGHNRVCTNAKGNHHKTPLQMQQEHWNSSAVLYHPRTIHNEQWKTHLHCCWHALPFHHL